MDLLFIFITAVDVTTFVTSAIGNSLVIILMIKDEKLKKNSANIYIVAIAIADLLSGLCAIPFFLYVVIIFFIIHYRYQ